MWVEVCIFWVSIIWFWSGIWVVCFLCLFLWSVWVLVSASLVFVLLMFLWPVVWALSKECFLWFCVLAMLWWLFGARPLGRARFR